MRRSRILLASIVLASLVGTASVRTPSARADTISSPSCMHYAPAYALANPPVTCAWVEDMVKVGDGYWDASCFELPNKEGGNLYGHYDLYTEYKGWTYTDGNGMYYYSWLSDGSAGPYHIVTQYSRHICSEP